MKNYYECKFRKNNNCLPMHTITMPSWLSSASFMKYNKKETCILKNRALIN